jgi:cytosine/uracil/thiamine/allantoin permease
MNGPFLQLWGMPILLGVLTIIGLVSGAAGRWLVGPGYWSRPAQSPH